VKPKSPETIMIVWCPTCNLPLEIEWPRTPMLRYCPHGHLTSRHRYQLVKRKPRKT